MQRRLLSTFVLTALSLSIAPNRAAAQWRPNGVPVCTAPNTQSGPVVVADGLGGAIVAWTDGRSGLGPDIYAQRLTPSGAVDRRWPANGLPICTAVGQQGQVRAVSDGDGGAIVVWQDFRSGGLSTDGDIYAQRILASGTVDPGWPSDGLAVCTAPNEQLDLAVVRDGMGGVIVTWEDRRSETDIYAQHVLQSGVVDPAWPHDGRALCIAPGGQSQPAIVSDGAHGAIVAWRDHRDDYGDIYAQRVLATGAVDPAWPADGRALCTAYEEQRGLVMTSDGAGGAIVAWTDLRLGYSGFIDAYAQRVLASGDLAAGWPEDGLPIATAPNDQDVTGIAPDGSGGAIIIWTDTRDNRFDIYAHHVLASGELDPDWPVDGAPVSTAPPGVRYPAQIAADGTGGAIIAWADQRGSGGAEYDIYAQRLLSSGKRHPAWPPDGLPVCTAPGDQRPPTMALVGRERAMVVWSDQRVAHDDIYAQRLFLRVPLALVIGAHDSPKLALEQGPASTSLVIRFVLPAVFATSLDVFDVQGRQVRTIIKGEELPSGTHSFVWDTTDDAGMLVKRGVYLVRLKAGDHTLTRKHIVLH